MCQIWQVMALSHVLYHAWCQLWWRCSIRTQNVLWRTAWQSEKQAIHTELLVQSKDRAKIIFLKKPRQPISHTLVWTPLLFFRRRSVAHPNPWHHSGGERQASYRGLTCSLTCFSTNSMISKSNTVTILPDIYIVCSDAGIICKKVKNEEMACCATKKIWNPTEIYHWTATLSQIAPKSIYFSSQFSW